VCNFFFFVFFFVFFLFVFFFCFFFVQICTTYTDSSGCQALRACTVGRRWKHLGEVAPAPLGGGLSLRAQRGIEVEEGQEEEGRREQEDAAAALFDVITGFDQEAAAALVAKVAVGKVCATYSNLCTVHAVLYVQYCMYIQNSVPVITYCTVCTYCTVMYCTKFSFLLCLQMETQDPEAVLRWLDRMLVRFGAKFGRCIPDMPPSFLLGSNLFLFPSFVYHLRRSPFLQVSHWACPVRMTGTGLLFFLSEFQAQVPVIVSATFDVNTTVLCLTLPPQHALLN